MSPGALDELLLLKHVQTLARGESIGRPSYDFSTHSRTEAVDRIIPGDFVIVEGLFALHWLELRRLLSTKVYIQVDDEVCYQRRLERDVRERGRTPESVLEQYRSTVRPMAKQWVWPSRHHADLIVSGVEPLEQSSATVLAHIHAHRSSMSGVESRLAFAD